MEIQDRIKQAADYIRAQTSQKPQVGLVLGSGLGGFADQIEGSVVIPFADIPGFPVPTVEGHTGEVIIGQYGGCTVMALRGRIHFYEGLPQQVITIPVRVMRTLGVHTLVLTNAAGGLNPKFSAGALMLIRDHINYSGSNPLIGPNLEEFGPRFPDMTDVYTKELREALHKKALAGNIKLHEGVYAMYSGPNYETPAEIKMFGYLGADAVGMSTVPEAIVARHAGMRVIGVSCITNMAAGLQGKPLSHAEVVETAERVKTDFMKLVSMAIEVGKKN